MIIFSLAFNSLLCLLFDLLLVSVSAPKILGWDLKLALFITFAEATVEDYCVVSENHGLYVGIYDPQYE